MTPHVLILGGGYAGIHTARKLANRARLTIASDTNFVLFTPMLAEVAAGDLDPRHIITPLRHLAPHARVVQGKVTKIDLGRNAATVEAPLGLDPVEVEADVLVIALGAVPNTFGVPGVEENALFFKSISDGLRIRNRLLALLEASSERRDPHLTRVAVVGAGYSGAEVAAALADFLRPAAARYFPDAPRPLVHLVDAVDRVAPTLPESLSHAAEAALIERGVDLVLGRRVTAVTEEGVDLEDGTHIAAATVIWAAGIRANPLVDDLDLPKEKGRLVVDGHLRAAEGVFALGDLAHAPSGLGGGPAPPTGQFAVRQGKYLGKHLPEIVRGKKVHPFRYRSLGELVSLGHRNAVGKVLGVPVSGFPGWFLWRSYYLFRLPSMQRRARVALDWTLDLVFPPDIAWLPSSDLGPNP